MKGKEGEGVKVEIRNIDSVTFNDLFSPCRECIYWEHPTKCGKVTPEEGRRLKLEWFKMVKNAFGTCGKFLKSIIEDVKRRGGKSIETYARDDSTNNPSGPTKFYLDNGFKKIESKKWSEASFSLLRLSWEVN